jgi:signal transduction histidine kinase
MCSFSLAKLLGTQEPDEWIGKFVINMFNPCSFEELKTLINGGKSNGDLCRLSNQEGKNPSVAVAIEEFDDKIITMICIPVPDHTTTIELLQNELEVTKENLKDLGDFNALMVHDLNGLLNVTLLTLDYLQMRNTTMPKEIEDNFNRIVRVSQRMGLLLNEISKFGQYEIGHYPTELTDMNMLIDSIIRNFDFPPLKDVTLLRSSELPNIQCNAPLIRELFHNLIDNSVLYSKSKVTISIGKVNTGERVEYFVKDSGVGIPESELQAVLSPLNRADHQQLNANGTGMGLAQVKKIIQRHHGNIWLTSSINVGTTVWFTLDME